ncbi:MAG: glycoside hydrolase family 2 protein [Gemmatimonadota bacterium]|nr:MAG: glycoside hydrolase family 2 protein [Gemmatimonadota bacterium]
MKRDDRSWGIPVSVLLMLLLIISFGNAVNTNIVKDGNSSEKILYFTPDRDLNIQLKNGEVDPFKVFGVITSDDGLTINPSLREGWTWLAAKNLHYKGRPLHFFFFDGWLYTNESIFTSHRRQKFQRNVSAMIQSNVFLIAFYSEKIIEKELAIFIASEEEIDAELVIDKELWGEEKKITYHLQAGEGHFISVMKMSEEFKPLFFPSKQVTRRTLDLNQGWKFLKQDIHDAFQEHYNDDNWEDVSLPHCWNAADVYDTRNINDGYEEYHAYYRGPGWYRKYFSLDPSTKGKKIIIQFEAANQIAEVWINGRRLGKHIGGYTEFSFDISDQVNFGETKNLVVVKVDNSYDYNTPPHTADFIMYGGLYRDVRLHVMNNPYIQDVYITSPEVSEAAAKVWVATTVRNDSEEEADVVLLTNIVNTEGEICATAIDRRKIEAGSSLQIDQVSSTIQYPSLWSPEHPYLYSVFSTLSVDKTPVDEIETPFGFRWYSFDPDNGFFLNDRPLKLRGVNKHQDYLGLGNAVPDSLQVRDIEIIKKMGANFIRLAHYPHDPSVLDACDKMGLFVWEEIPLVNSIGGEEFFENTKAMMREMVRRDRNHPSVILWGITNESAMRFANREQVPKIIQLLRELNDIAHQEDPSRLTVQAHNHLKDPALADITDVIGRNRYYGWYEGSFEDFERVMDEEHQAHPHWKIIISEYGVGSKRGHHVENPIAFDFSEEYQIDFHEHYLRVINERSWIAGGAVWNAFDFGSFVKRGNVPRINQKGLCDMVRRPKDVYYFYQSQWTEEPMVYIVSHTQRFYQGPRGKSRKIRVYSNCDSVELFLNGEALGQKEKHYVFFWDVFLNAGENRLKAVAKKGHKIVEDRIDVTYLIEEDPPDESK